LVLAVNDERDERLAVDVVLDPRSRCVDRS
jgi:hypothetical protein